jgi:hypothetical protein
VKSFDSLNSQALVDTGTLAAGGPRHAPGGSLYGEVLTAREATQALA